MKKKGQWRKILAGAVLWSLMLGDFSVYVRGTELVSAVTSVSEEKEMELSAEDAVETEAEPSTGDTEKTEPETQTECITEVPEEDSEKGTEVSEDFSSESETCVETEGVTETENDSVVENVPESETEWDIEAETESEYFAELESETETGFLTELESETEILDLDSEMISTYLAKLPASGKSVIGASGWTQATGINRVSSNYRPVKFYGGISSMEVFYDSSKVKRVDASGNVLFYPLSSDQEGKFGVIYRKVLYYNNQWYDLKMTVAAYSNEVLCDGGSTVASRTFMEFEYNTIGFHFHEALGEYVLKCEFLNSQTGAVSKVNTRFQWLDIDGAQRYGIRLVDGSIDARYYYGNSKLNYQTGQRVAGVTGMEMVVGPYTTSTKDDMEYAAVYELKQCSTYYMAIGFRDHLEDSDSSLTKKSIQTSNAALAEGTYSGNKSYLEQTDTWMNIIETPAPEKQVSSDGTTWSTENTLATPRSTYWYRLQQFVPWQSTEARYSAFVIKDALPSGADYVGSIQILRVEDGKDVTGWFTVSAEQNVVTATAKSSTREASGFYGYHYRLSFQVRMNPEKADGVYEGTKASFSVINQASVTASHSLDGSTTEKKSNIVRTTASLQRQEQSDPKKGFDEEDQLTEKMLLTEEDEFVYGIFQELPVNDAIFHPASVEISDTLESCLQYVDAVVQIKKKGSVQWENLTGWKVEVSDPTAEGSGQMVTASGSYGQEYGGGILLLQIRCRIGKNANLDAWKQTEGEQSVTSIPNQAAVTFSWKTGNPQKVTKETNVVHVKVKKSRICLTKEIDSADVVWEHGNPTFLFRVEGTDLGGRYHIWYQAVEFTPEMAGADADGKAAQTATFEVPIGVYVASEEPVIRYELETIHSVSGGTADGETVLFDLSSGQNGAAVFYNKKRTDEGESDTVLVQNHIGS